MDTWTRKRFATWFENDIGKLVLETNIATYRVRIRDAILSRKKSGTGAKIKQFLILRVAARFVIEVTRQNESLMSRTLS